MVMEIQETQLTEVFIVMQRLIQRMINTPIISPVSQEPKETTTEEAPQEDHVQELVVPTPDKNIIAFFN